MTIPLSSPDLLRFVDRADKQAHLDGKQLNVRKIDLDVTDDHQTLVEDAVENVDQSVRSRRGN